MALLRAGLGELRPRGFRCQENSQALTERFPGEASGVSWGPGTAQRASLPVCGVQFCFKYTPWSLASPALPSSGVRLVGVAGLPGCWRGCRLWCGICPATPVPWPISSTLPGKSLEDIAAQMRTHSINALLIIGGFEVRPWPGAPAGAVGG